MRDRINKHWKKLLVRARCVSQSTFDRGSKEHRLDLSTNQENYDQAYPSSFTLAQNEDVLMLSDTYLFRQGMPLGMSLICVFFVLLMPLVLCISALLSGAQVIGIAFSFLVLMPMAAALASMAYIPIKYELDRMPVSPVVFNRKTGKVYFFGDISGEAQSYLWHQCHFSVVHMVTLIGYPGKHYELRGYILDDDDNVIDSFSFGAEYVIPSINSELLKDYMVGAFEYVRRFMNNETVPEIEYYIPIRPDWKSYVSRIFDYDYDPSWISKMIKKSSILFAIGSFPQYFGYKLCWKNGRFPVWPKQFVDECGPEIVIKR